VNVTSKIILRGSFIIYDFSAQPLSSPHCSIASNITSTHFYLFTLHPSHLQIIPLGCQNKKAFPPFPNKLSLASNSFLSFTSCSTFFFFTMKLASQGILKDDRPFTSSTAVTRDLRANSHLHLQSLLSHYYCVLLDS